MINRFLAKTVPRAIEDFINYSSHRLMEGESQVSEGSTASREVEHTEKFSSVFRKQCERKNKSEIDFG